MSDSSKIRIGFCGVGGMGQMAHLRNYASLRDECDVVALAEIRPKLAKRVSEKFGVPRIYPSHEAMLKEEKLDAIVASQPFTRHGTLVPELLKAKVPIFTEKPIAASVEVAKKIVEAVERSGTFVMVGYHKRSDPATMYAKAEIDRLKASGELGPLQYVRILMPAGDWIRNGFFDLIQTDDAMPPLEFDPPASDMDKASFDKYVGFVNYYIHQVNLMRYLLGESYRVTFTDKAGMLLVGESKSGITCTIEMSPYVTSREWEESALIAFKHGYIKLELPAPVTLNAPGRVEIYRDPPIKGNTPTRTIPTLLWDHAMRQQARNFIKAVRKEVPPPCDQTEALEDLLVAREYLRMHSGV